MAMKKIIYIVSLFLCNSILAIDNYNANETLNVLSVSGLKFRDRPDGNVMQTIPYGSKVVTLESKNNNYPKTVEGIKGTWVKVNFNGTVGFVFDGFLSRLPSPQLTDQEIETYVNREFGQMSEAIPTFYLKNNEFGPTGSFVLFFEWRNKKCVFENHFYYEGGGENLSIYGVSLEEAYLLVRVIYRELYKATLEVAESDDIDKRPLREFILNGISYNSLDNGQIQESRDYYFCELYDGCGSELTIAKHLGYTIISLDGGC
jgi:Bacterial SH3 domain